MKSITLNGEAYVLKTAHTCSVNSIKAENKRLKAEKKGLEAELEELKRRMAEIAYMAADPAKKAADMHAEAMKEARIKAREEAKAREEQRRKDTVKEEERKGIYDSYQGWRARGRQVTRGQKAAGFENGIAIFHVNQTTNR